MIYAIIGAAFVVGAVIAALLICAAAKTKNSRRRKTRRTAAEPPAQKRKVEFSKLILLFVMFTYFIAVGVGVKLSFIDYTQYSTLAMLVGAPTATAIGFYAWKAKAENTLKIKKENPKETEGSTFDPSNIM